jgi:hypothetical protein
MKNESERYGRASSRRRWLSQKSLFLGFNDYQDGIWGEDYETKREHWQISYEWGRQLAAYCEAEEIKVNWTSINKIPRSLTDSVWGALHNYVLI